MAFRIITGFDGSCPSGEKGIKQINPSCYVAYPSYRRRPGIDEETPGAGSRFCIKIENSSNQAAPVKIIADWETPKRVKHHDYGFIRHPVAASSWRMIPGLLHDGTKIGYELELPPGITELGLLPNYNCGDLDSFISGIADKGFIDRVVGKSGEGRVIHLLSCESADKSAPNFLIQARDHSYESAGSFCVEGIVDCLASDDPVAAFLKTKFNFHILPMTNPDGVYNGLSRLTHEKGLNVDCIYWNGGAGPEVGILLGVLDKIKPSVYMNIHNWVFKFIDGLMGADEETVKSIVELMPPDTAHLKKWKLDYDALWCQRNNMEEYLRECRGGRHYCKEKFDSIAAVFEFPWFGRTAESMRQRGVQGMKALAAYSIDKLKI